MPTETSKPSRYLQPQAQIAWLATRYVVSCIFMVLLAFLFRPFPTDQETYGVYRAAETNGDPWQLAYLCLLGTAAVYVIYDMVRHPAVLQRDLRGLLPLMLPFGIAAASIFWTVDLNRTIYSVALQVTTIGIVTILTSRIVTARDSLRFLVVVTQTCLVISIVGITLIPGRSIHQTGAGILLSPDLNGLWRGAFIHKNYAGGFLMVGLCATLTHVYVSKACRLTLLSLLVPLVIFLAQSGSITSLVAPAAGLVVAATLFQVRNSPLFRAAATVAFIAALFIFPFLVAYYLYPTYGITLEGRAQIWLANFALFSSHEHVLGSGFQAVYSGQSGISAFDNYGYIARLGTHAHSGVVEVFGQLGVLGAIALFLALYLLLSRAILLTRQPQEQGAAFGLLFCACAILVRSTVEPDIFSHRIHWYMLVLIGLAVYRAENASSDRDRLALSTPRSPAYSTTFSPRRDARS